jgi:hypothetical protein
MRTVIMNFPIRRMRRSVTISVLLWISLGLASIAQSDAALQNTTAGGAVPVIPQQMRFNGTAVNRSGETVEAVFSIYATQEGGDPLWTETQKVMVDAAGSYTVLLGSASQLGLPQTIFAGGAARWLGIAVERAPELPRVLLSSVPYAMKSADAQALAGHPAGDFVTQEQLSQFAQIEAQRTMSAEFQPLTTGTITGSGTAGTIAQFTGANTIGNSLITQSGSMIGIGETTPVARLDVNGGGQFRGTLLIPAKGTATTSTSEPSEDLEFAASGWSTTAAGPVTPTFYFYNGVLGNNTANPTGEIQLGYQLGTSHNDVLSITGTGPLYAYGGFTAATNTLASSSAASNSPPVQMNAYAYSSKTSGQVEENFAWQVMPTGNDTASPSANLDLLYGTGSTSPTGLSISSNGTINFAPGQTFPITGTGGGTITGVTAGSGLTGGGTSGAVTLNVDSTKVPFLSSTTNSFTGAISVAGALNGSSAAFSAVSSPVVSATDTATGVYGQLGATDVYGHLVGVYGEAGSSSSFGYIGVYGDGNTGVLGTGAADGVDALGSNYGVNAISQNFGVYGAGYKGSYGELGGTVSGNFGGYSSGVFGMGGYDTSTGVTGIGNELGVAGQSTVTGVYGYGGDNGVEGYDSTNNSIGYLGTTTNGYATGVYGNATTYGVFGLGGTYGTVGESSGYIGVYGQGPTYGVYSDGAIGSESYSAAVAALPDNRVVEFYSVASTENWFEDYGTGQLRNGSVAVTLDPTYAQAVNTDGGYHVFLTPNGDCDGLYVTRKTATSFEVHELHAGKSNIEFDYRIVARRRGFEGMRMEPLDADSQTVEQIRDEVANRPAHRTLILRKPSDASMASPRTPPAGFPIHPAAPTTAIPRPPQALKPQLIPARPKE